ncbi:MAG: FMN-binding protein [Candidatus Brocadiia bacterium]|nr:FMN-binding protein [Candidatus Brocadiia bacterium]
MKDKLFTVGFMIALAAVFTTGVSGVHLATRERIALNKKLKERRVVMQVLAVEVPPGAGLKEIDNLYDERIRETGLFLDPEERKRPVFRSVTADGQVTGYAFEIGGRGFWDAIRGYLAVSPNLKTIQGIAFFEQSETPGLGAEIEKSWFREQFTGKAIPAEADAKGRLIRFMPPGSELGPHEVDAVTGATGTSRAVELFLNRDLRLFLDLVPSEPSGN